jgi:hypothetical protein
VTKTSPCWYGFIVPASTLMYGSSFWIDTETPRLFSSRPSEAAVIPFPSELTTPPVKKMNLAMGMLRFAERSNDTGSGAGAHSSVGTYGRFAITQSNGA